jgi:hypothetical protein
MCKWFRQITPLGGLLFCTLWLGGQAENPRYAYFFSLDQYVKLEISTQRVVTRGSLYDKGELKLLLPASLQKGGPPTLGQYDTNSHRLYFLATQPESYSGDKWKERIIIVELPDFKLVGRIDLDHFIVSSVNLLLTPDGRRLFVSYDFSQNDKDNYVFVREAYDTQSFKLLETKRAVIQRNQRTPDAGRGFKFSAQARFSEDGQTIFDEDVGSSYPQAFGGEEYMITGEQVSKRKKPDWPVAVKEFKAKNAGYSPVWSLASPARVILLDLKHHEVVIEIRDSQTGKYSPKKVNGDPFTTGRIVFYDAASGGRLRELTMKDLAGDNPNILCLTPDGRIAYFQKSNAEKQWEHYAVDSVLGKALKIELFNAMQVQCVFSDR